MTKSPLPQKHLFCFGFGYTASFLAAQLAQQGWKISGTTTNPAKKKFLESKGIKCWLFDDIHSIPDPFKTFGDVTHILLSIPPDADGDTVFETYADDIAAMKNLEWVGYLSTTAVYGNHDGSWIDENTQTAPSSRRGSLRLKAEQQWLSLHYNEGIPLHIFRLSGIYGPGRSAIETVRSGHARRIDKPGHVFNRIHVDDIVQVLMASIHKPHAGGVYNLSDDNPSPSHEVIQCACDLAGIVAPPLTPFEQSEMAPIVRSFYKDNKRIRNDKIKDELGVTLRYADYRLGLMSCLEPQDEILELLRFANDDSGG